MPGNSDAAFEEELCISDVTKRKKRKDIRNEKIEKKT